MIRTGKVDMNIKVGLVGCGRIAHRHGEVLSGGAVEGITLAACCDLDYAKAERLSQKFSIPSFGSIEDMFGTLEINCLAILNESGNHAQTVIDATKFGVPIVVEKPMALTLQDADEMNAACRSHNVKLFVVKQNRFNRPVRYLRKVVDQGGLGELFMGTVRVRWCRDNTYYQQDDWRGTWALDGGVLANQASHHLDLLEWFMGDVSSVVARSGTYGSDIEVEDTALAIVKFRSGALGSIEVTTATRPVDLEGSLSLMGSKGVVEIAGFAVNKVRTWNIDEEPDIPYETKEFFSENPPDVYGFGHVEYYRHVVDCLANGARPLVDGVEARKSLELLTAIYESIETGEEVRLPFEPKFCRLGR